MVLDSAESVENPCQFICGCLYHIWRISRSFCPGIVTGSEGKLSTMFPVPSCQENMCPHWKSQGLFTVEFYGIALR